MPEGTVKARQTRAELTRGRIVDCATQLIYEKGYTRTTIDEVIDAAGVTKGSFYYHFSSKEEMGCAVIDNAASDISKRIGKRLSREQLSPFERIKRMLQEIRTIVETVDCSRGCIIGNLALEMSNSHDEFRERIAGVFRSWSSFIASQLDEMKASGSLPMDFDSPAYADFVVSAMEGGIMMSKVTLDPSPMRNSVNMALKTLEGLESRR